MSLEAFLPAGIDGGDVVVVLAGLAALLTVMAVWNGLVARDPMAGRARAIAKRQQALKDGMLAPKRRGARKVDAVTFMRRIINRLDLLRSAEARKMEAKMAQAGWRSKDAMVTYLFFKISLPFAFGALAVVAVYVFDAYKMAPLMQLTVALLAVVIGAYAPEIYVKNAATKRQRMLQKGLPDALDLLVICAEAGLSMDAAMKRVGTEMGRTNPPIAEEFGLCAVELGFLPDRKDALSNLATRTGMASIRGVVNTLIQTERYGTPLAQSLRVLAAEFRTERMLKAEEKAAALPAKLTLPMIVFILPPLFVVLLGSGILQAIDSWSGM